MNKYLYNNKRLRPYVLKIIEHSFLIILLFPILFINIKSSHDWGDDFAQYIHQAKNILSGLSQNDTGYIYNDSISVIGPKAYPTGFPLILSIFIYFAGDSIHNLNLLMSLWLIAACTMGYFILRLRYGYILSVCSTLIIAYNPMMLNFKTEIMSDLPFTFFSLWCIYLMHKKESIWKSLLLGILIAFSIHIRLIGIVLIAAYIIYKYFEFKFEYKKYGQTLVTIITILFFYVLLKISFPCNTFYPSTPDAKGLWLTVNNHASYNLESLHNFFHQYYSNNDYLLIGIIASSGFITFCVIGMLWAMFKELKSINIIYSTIYLALIVSFRFSDAGLRFLYPILFLLFGFAIQAFKLTIQPLLPQIKWLPVPILLLLLFFYKPEILRMINTKNMVLEGPQIPKAKEVFKFIRLNIKSNKIIAFDKPRALAYYTSKSSVMLSPNFSAQDLYQEIKKFKVEYVLIDSKYSHNNTKEFTKKDTTHCKLEFTNNDFLFYKLKF